MFSKVRVTDVVPAPEEPVIAIMGWRSDMTEASKRCAEQSALVKQRIREIAPVWIEVKAFDSLNFVPGAEHHADALVQRTGLNREDRLAPSARTPPGLLHHERDRVRFIQQAQSP